MRRLRHARTAVYDAMLNAPGRKAGRRHFYLGPGGGEHPGLSPSKERKRMAEILMPKATAVWLVDNTSLAFDQIADFCGLHPLEVKGIADEDVAKGIKGQDPVASG